MDCDYRQRGIIVTHLPFVLPDVQWCKVVGKVLHHLYYHSIRVHDGSCNVLTAPREYSKTNMDERKPVCERYVTISEIPDSLMQR